MENNNCLRERSDKEMFVSSLRIGYIAVVDHLVKFVLDDGTLNVTILLLYLRNE